MSIRNTEHQTVTLDRVEATGSRLSEAFIETYNAAEETGSLLAVTIHKPHQQVHIIATTGHLPDDRKVFFLRETPEAMTISNTFNSQSASSTIDQIHACFDVLTETGNTSHIQITNEPAHTRRFEQYLKMPVPTL